MYSVEKFLHHVEVGKPSGLKALMTNYLLNQFGLGMVSVFGVLYIFQLSSDLIYGLVYVVLFYGLQRLVVAGMVPLVGAVTAKVGYRRMMFLGLTAIAVKLWFLIKSSTGMLWPLGPAIVLGGFGIAAYYLSYHALFLDDNDDSRIGEQMGMLTMLGRVAMIAAPLAAGLIVDFWGFNTMFGVALGILIVSTLPLWLMQEHERHSDYSTKKAVKLIKESPRFSWSMWAWYVSDGIQSFLWPVYLFLVVTNYTKFGLINSLALTLNSLAVYFSGKTFDKRPLRRAHMGIAGLVSVTWIWRFLSKTPVMAALADGTNRFLSPFWWMKIRRSELVLGERRDSLVFGAAHEWVASAGIITGLIIGFLILVVFKGAWWWLAVPAIVTTLVSAKLVRKR